MSNYLKIVRLFSVKSNSPYVRMTTTCIVSRAISCTPQKAAVVRMMYNRREIGPGALSLLLIPISTLGLGVWQIKRKKWKDELELELHDRPLQEPVQLPEDLSEIDKMEYHPIKVTGVFDHSREMYIGPRSLLTEGDTMPASIISRGQGSGYNVVTPFTLSDRNLTILVNRGWVSNSLKHPNTRAEGQVTSEVELVGLVRHTEKRPPLGIKNTPNSGFWIYRDVPNMAEAAGTEPVFIDAVKSTTVPGGPVGGQTRIGVSNNHLSYIITWFGLSAATTAMWFNTYLKKSRF